MTWFLSTICREPLLTAAEEIELGNHIQNMMKILADGKTEFSEQEARTIRLGRKSKNRMMKANLRLVVSVWMWWM